MIIKITIYFVTLPRGSYVFDLVYYILGYFLFIPFFTFDKEILNFKHLQNLISQNTTI